MLDIKCGAVGICGRDRFIVLVEFERNHLSVLINFGFERSGVFKEDMVEFRPNNIPS